MEQEFGEFSEFRESDKYRSINRSQFKDPVSHLCFAGAVVASQSLTQEVAGSNPFTVMTNAFVNEFAEFSENIQRKLKYDKLISHINILFHKRTF